MNKLEKDEVFLPQFNNQRLPAPESEWLSWNGLQDETADQIDAATYAARHATGRSGVTKGLIVPRSTYFGPPAHRWN